jgi:hypothetical protein
LSSRCSSSVAASPPVPFPPASASTGSRSADLPASAHTHSPPRTPP